MTIEDYFIAGDAVSRSFRLRANDKSIAVVETPPMDAAERERLAAEYRKLPDYCHIYDTAGMHVHYAHFAAEGEVTLCIEAVEVIRHHRIHPLRKAMVGQVAGRSLTFQIGAGGPRHFIVRINNLPPLMLAIEKPQKDALVTGDPEAIDAMNFLTDATGASNQTARFQRAVAAVNGTGHTLVVPAGTYLVTQLHVKNGRNFRIYFAAGCLLKIQASAHGENAHCHGLWLEDCTDVSVLGPGCIDHQAYEHYVLGGNQYQHGIVDYYTANELCPWTTQSPLFITGSQRILVDGLVIRNGRNFNVNCRGCDELTLRRIKIFTPPACTPEYADGINTGSCHGVLIEDCLVASNDDCFASGHYLGTYDTRTSADHVIRRMLGWTIRGSGARLGFFSAHDQGDFIFEDCDFVAMTYTTLLVHPLGLTPAGRPGRYGTIRAKDCAFDDVPRLTSLLDVQKPAIDSLELVNFTLHGAPRTTAALIVEGDPAAGIGQLVLNNVVLDGKSISRLEEIPHQIAQVAKVVVTSDASPGNQATASAQ